MLKVNRRRKKSYEIQTKRAQTLFCRGVFSALCKTSKLESCCRCELKSLQCGHVRHRAVCQDRPDVRALCSRRYSRSQRASSSGTSRVMPQGTYTVRRRSVSVVHEDYQAIPVAWRSGCTESGANTSVQCSGALNHSLRVNSSSSSSTAAVMPIAAAATRAARIALAPIVTGRYCF